MELYLPCYPFIFSNEIQCGNWKSICVFPVLAKMLAIIIQECIKEHLESLIDSSKAWFPLWILLHRSREDSLWIGMLHLLFIVLGSVNRECIWIVSLGKDIPEKTIYVRKYNDEQNQGS